jgi:hypothetical protein
LRPAQVKLAKDYLKNKLKANGQGVVQGEVLNSIPSIVKKKLSKP